jgi:hypothetical protein
MFKFIGFGLAARRRQKFEGVETDKALVADLP